MRTRNLSMATLLLMSVVAVTAHRKRQERSPIIDVHVHAYGRDERLTRALPNPRTGRPMTATTEQVHMEATLAEMKKYNIVRAV